MWVGMNAFVKTTTFYQNLYISPKWFPFLFNAHFPSQLFRWEARQIPLASGLEAMPQLSSLSWQGEGPPAARPAPSPLSTTTTTHIHTQHWLLALTDNNHQWKCWFVPKWTVRERNSLHSEGTTLLPGMDFGLLKYLNLTLVTVYSWPTDECPHTSRSPDLYQATTEIWLEPCTSFYEWKGQMQGREEVWKASSMAAVAPTQGQWRGGLKFLTCPPFSPNETTLVCQSHSLAVGQNFYFTEENVTTILYISPFFPLFSPIYLCFNCRLFAHQPW